MKEKNSLNDILYTDYSMSDDGYINSIKVNIQWFPGHMAKTRRLISDNLKLVDLAAEVVDARVPISSRNPIVDELLASKPRIVLLNKADLSDPKANEEWAEFFKKQGIPAVMISCQTGAGIGNFFATAKKLLANKLARDSARGMNKSIRVMITGVPNVGKSTFINKIAGEKKAKAEDRPGVTRSKQWIRLDSGIDLLDTPGILWPKFEDEEVGLNLAFTGAIKDEVYDYEMAAMLLAKKLAENYPKIIADRYKLADASELIDAENPLEIIGKKRGFLLSGGVIDTERTARMLLDEFRGGKIGRITLEFPPKQEI